MIPSITAVRMTGARNRAELPLLVLGPSLGTSATTLWTAAAAAGLTDVFDVVAWDLPGHGHNRSAPDEPFTMAELATGVLRVVDDLVAERGEVGGGFAYAGVSVGGAVGLHLLLKTPGRVSSAVLLCTGARLGDEASWADRIERVDASGTPGLVAASSERWFGAGFLERERETGSALLNALRSADDDAYVLVCGALADHDVRNRLAEIRVPVLAVAGAEDVAAPPEKLREIAEGVKDGRYVELPGVAHLAPAEAPGTVARLVREHVLGDSAPTIDFSREFQDLITQSASGDLWSRPGLDRGSRALISLTALVARGRHEELEPHVRAALRSGLGEDEIRELLLQTAVYCGVPDASTAFRIAQRVIDEESGRPASR